MDLGGTDEIQGQAFLKTMLNILVIQKKDIF
jgi:hypothetical protein